MSNKDVQIKILAQAIYELKHLLDGYLGSTDKNSYLRQYRHT